MSYELFEFFEWTGQNNEDTDGQNSSLYLKGLDTRDGGGFWGIKNLLCVCVVSSFCCCDFCLFGVFVAAKMTSVVEDAQVSGYDLVLQHCSSRDIDTVSVIGNNNDGSLDRRHEMANDLLTKGKSYFFC